MPDTHSDAQLLSLQVGGDYALRLYCSCSRDNIVRHGEMFLKRRQKVASRGADLFIIKVIWTLIAFARGEIDKTCARPTSRR